MKMYKKLRLGIVGHGFVGKATDWGFNKKVEKFIVIPLWDMHRIKNLIQRLFSYVSRHQ